jgi:hypothetical protein
MEGCINQGDTVKMEMETMTGAKEVTCRKENDSFLVTFIGNFGCAATANVSIPRSLTASNKNGENADLFRAILMIGLRYAGLEFQPGAVEDRGFKKLRKSLWP